MMLGLSLALSQPRRVASGGDPSIYTNLAWSTDFVTGFEITPTGVNGSGERVWANGGAATIKLAMNSIASADQIVADATTYPTSNPFPVVGGKRQMRAEKLGAAISQVRSGFTLNSTYTSAFMDSAGYVAFRYGYLEINWKQLPGLLTGGSSAFWLGSNGWPPEIDVAENFTSVFGSPPTWKDFLGQHFIKYSGDGHDQQGSDVVLNSIIGITPITNLNSEYHRFGVEITPSTIYHYVDGILVKSYPNRAPGTWWHVYLNTLNKRFAETPDPAGFPYITELDYLKFWTLPGQSSEAWQWTPISAPYTTYAWDPARSTQQLSYSSGNTIATHAGHVPWWVGHYVGNAESAISKGTCGPTDKMCATIEITFSEAFSVGVGTQAANMVSVGAMYPDIGADAASFGLTNYGWIQNNIAYDDYAPTGVFSDISPGTITVDLYADRPNNGLYLRVDGGDWNNDPTADPTANTGALDISALGSELLTLIAQTDQIGNTMKLLPITPLSGYTQWGTPAPAVAPSLRSAGVQVGFSGTTTQTGTLPTYTDNDILVWYIWSQGANVTVPPSGWTEITDASQATGSMLSKAYWRRVGVGETLGTQTFTIASNVGGRHWIYSYQDCTTTGSPIDVSAGGVSAASTSATLTSLTTTASKTLVCAMLCTARAPGSGSAVWSGITNANLSSLTERLDVSSSSALGGGMCLADGAFNGSGATGNTTATQATSAAFVWAHFALKPA